MKKAQAVAVAMVQGEHVRDATWAKVCELSCLKACSLVPFSRKVPSPWGGKHSLYFLHGFCIPYMGFHVCGSHEMEHDVPIGTRLPARVLAVQDTCLRGTGLPSFLLLLVQCCTEVPHASVCVAGRGTFGPGWGKRGGDAGSLTA